MDWSALERHLLLHGSREKGWSPTTVEKRLADLARLERAQLVELDAFTVDQGERALAELLKRGVGAPAFANYVVALNGLASFHRIAHRYRQRKRPPPVKRWPTEDELRRVLTYRHEDHDVGLLSRAVTVFAMNSILRPGEAQPMDRADVDVATRTVMVRFPLKGGKRRRIPLDPWMWHPKRPFVAYLSWLDELELDEPPLFVTRNRRARVARWRRVNLERLYEIPREVGAAVGVRINWTMYRRAGITERLRPPRSWHPLFVKELAGHVKIETTMGYADLRDLDLIAELERKPKKDPFSRRNVDAGSS